MTDPVYAAQAPATDKAPPLVAEPTDTDRKIEQWFADHFRNSVVSRAGSDVWNTVHGAVEDLKVRLKK